MASPKNGYSGKDRRVRLVFSTICLFTALSLCACATAPRAVLYPGAPTLLEGTDAAMNTAGFWIGRHPAPDSLILDADGIAELNRLIRGQKGVRDLSAFGPTSTLMTTPELPPLTGGELQKSLNDTVRWIASLKIYQRSGRKVDQKFLGPIVLLMNLENIPPVVGTDCGFLTRQTDLRVLPTAEPLFDAPGDAFVDNLQASSLDTGTALIVRHRSRDEAWLYVTTELAAGWLPASAVALADESSFMARYTSAATAVVTAAKADLYADEALTVFLGSVRMGTKLILEAPEAETAAEAAAIGISLCGRSGDGTLVQTTAWVSTDQIRTGYLPYTARTIYQQAFKLLNAPYGWGGSFGEQDCSQFLCEIFATVGVVLPRNSAWQSRIGVPLTEISAKAADEIKQTTLMESALPGATILRLPGHIMLYLGTDRGKPYVIHSTLAYREKRGFGEIKRLINRVTVSDMELGQYSERGSLLRRMTAAAMVTIPEPPQTEPVQTEPVQTEPVQTEPVQTEPVQTESAPEAAPPAASDPSPNAPL